MATVRNLSEEQIEYITEWFRTWECPEEEDLLKALDNMMNPKYLATRSGIQNWVAYQQANDGGFYRRDLNAVHEMVQTGDGDIEDIIREGYMYQNCLTEIDGLTEEDYEDKQLLECLYSILLDVFVEALGESDKIIGMREYMDTTEYKSKDKESNITEISKRIHSVMHDFFDEPDADVVREIANEVYKKLCEQRDPGYGIMSYPRMDTIIGEIMEERYL